MHPSIVSYFVALFQILFPILTGSPPPAVLPSVSQTCMAIAFGNSSCATSAATPTGNFVSGKTVYVFGASLTNLQTTPGVSGAGCPASWTLITGTTTSYWSKGITGTGACTLSSTLSSGSTINYVAWYLMANDTATVDGTGNAVVQTSCSGTPCSGAIYTTTHSGDAILAMIGQGASTTDANFAATAPFVTTSPFHLLLNGNGGQATAGDITQAAAGSIQIKWATSLTFTNWTSSVLGVY